MRHLRGWQVTADNKTYNVYLDDMGEEQRHYVGDIRDVRTFKVHPAGPIYRTWYLLLPGEQENRRQEQHGLCYHTTPECAYRG